MRPGRLVIVDGIRTPFCRAFGDAKNPPADELGRIATSSLLAKTGLDSALIDEVIFGCVCQPADAANIARIIALRSGIPKSVPAVTVHRNCASGLEAVTLAYERMMAGRGDIFVVGGVESMSRTPLLFRDEATRKFSQFARARSVWARLQSVGRFRPSDFSPRSALQLGLTDPLSGLNMGQTAELLAQEFCVSRKTQDEFAVRSHKRALSSRENLRDEICPIYAPLSRETIIDDNGPRADCTLQALSRLKPVFDPANGSVTAGNSSQISDGAVALLVMSEARANEMGIQALGALSSYAYAGCDPDRMGLGPVFALDKLERITGTQLSQADVIEINEAFAAQVLACVLAIESKEFATRQLARSNSLGKIDWDKLNVNGGAIALGHPVGATGARLILTTLKELKRRGGRHGLITLCVGGGQGGAVWVEAINP